MEPRAPDAPLPYAWHSGEWHHASCRKPQGLRAFPAGFYFMLPRRRVIPMHSSAKLGPLRRYGHLLRKSIANGEVNSGWPTRRAEFYAPP